jgi:hypothetical protein
MPSYGRWRHIKIVAPVPSREQEISGGIKNALDRGETLSKAKQTFINAGYTVQEVQTASQMVKSVPFKTSIPLDPSRPIQPNPTPESIGASLSGSSKKTIIILSVIGATILIAALVLGLFWEKLFGV